MTLCIAYCYITQTCSPKANLNSNKNGIFASLHRCQQGIFGNQFLGFDVMTKLTKTGHLFDIVHYYNASLFVLKPET